MTSETEAHAKDVELQQRSSGHTASALSGDSGGSQFSKYSDTDASLDTVGPKPCCHNLSFEDSTMENDFCLQYVPTCASCAPTPLLNIVL